MNKLVLLLVFIFSDTVLQPKIKKKKSVSKLEVKDTKEASKYMLTHQDLDSEDNLTTKIYKVGVPPKYTYTAKIYWVGWHHQNICTPSRYTR